MSEHPQYINGCHCFTQHRPTNCHTAFSTCQPQFSQHSASGITCKEFINDLRNFLKEELTQFRLAIQDISVKVCSSSPSHVNILPSSMAASDANSYQPSQHPVHTSAADGSMMSPLNISSASVESLMPDLSLHPALN